MMIVGSPVARDGVCYAFDVETTSFVNILFLLDIFTSQLDASETRRAILSGAALFYMYN